VSARWLAPGLAALTLALAVFGCGPTTERAAGDLERMRHQQRYDAFDESPAFADGMAMRAAPDSTVARETAVLGDSVATGTRDGAALASVPLSIGPSELAHGARLFGVYCAVCHGPDGAGGAVVGQNIRPAPPPLRTDRVAAMSSGELFGVVTHGRGRMPAYDWALPVDERWLVVAWVRSLQSGPKP
jgi:mono/diheme cytochrome c family protein